MSVHSSAISKSPNVRMIHHVLEDNILSGRFAREWSGVQAKGLERIRAEAPASALAQAEASVRHTS